MPFTASHPAAVIPLLGTGLPASALVIGSMSPDLPYYFPFITTSWPTHSWLGIFTLDPLIGLSAWVIWHGLLTAPALAHAPAGVQGRLDVETGLWIALAAVGAVTGIGAAVTSPNLQQAAFNGATTGGGAAAGLALVLASVWQLRRREAA